MFEKLKRILGSVEADYADIRYEVMKNVSIGFNSKELSTVGANTTDGYVVRVLKNGGMSNVSFTKESDAERAIKTAVENAELISKHIAKKVTLAEAEVVKETVKPNLIEDPRNISMEEKIELVRKYNDIALKHDKIVSTNMGYVETFREKYFVSSEGSEIQEDLFTVALSGMLTSREGTLSQSVRVGSGGSNGFQTCRNLEEYMEKRSGIVIDLLKAKPIEAGTYNCIVNPSLAGVFVHEAFGHFSEADIVETLPAMRKKMEIGSKLGTDVVNIIDDATMPNQLGYYKYDDEGVAVRPVQLMKNGVLTGRLHSRRTAAEFGEPISGHTVAQDYRYAPIVRMGNIYIQPGDSSFEELLAQLGDGLYILDPKGGQTAGDNFTFGAQYGYFVRDGKIAEMIRDINISGNLYKTLMDIPAVGNDLTLGKVGGCGKGQTNIRSTHGGPHMIINNLVLGGV